MTTLLTAELEDHFIDYFGPPRFPVHHDHRPAAKALLYELKRISAPLSLRLEVENLGLGAQNTYPRIHAVLPSAAEPIIWALCAPSNDPTGKVENYKLEVLPRRTAELRTARLYRECERIAARVHIKPASKLREAILTIGITPKLTATWAADIADAVAEITAVVRPIYP